MKIRNEPSGPKRTPLKDVPGGTCFIQPHIARVMLRTQVMNGNTVCCCAMNDGSVYWISADAPVIPIEAELVVTGGLAP